MKIKNKIKHSLLTATILLAVSGGSGYAMPTGGNVTMGNVTNVSNPAEIMTANANSIINWDSFSVGVGEKVTFDTQKFMVLNRVIGGQESQILGMLSDQGQGKLLLINPAGIVLGENAVINANDLVLSTLRISDSEFKKLINGNSAIFEDVANDRGEIKLKSGTNLTLNEALRLYGGKITIADGVEIISKENSSAKVEIAAGIEGVTDLKKHHSNTYAMGTDVEIGDANIGTMSNPISNITIKSSKTTLDKADVVVNGNNNDEQHNIIITSAITNINSSKLLNRCGDIFIANTRRGSWSYDKDGSIKTFSAVADPDYEVSVRNSNINTEKEKNITIIGGNVTLDHSQLNSGKDIFVGAVKTYDSVEGVRTATTYDSSIINADKDTVIHARGYAEAYGANLNIQAQRFDNVIDTKNPLIKYIGKDGVPVWEIIPYIEGTNELDMDYFMNVIRPKIQTKVESEEAIAAIKKFNDALNPNVVVEKNKKKNNVLTIESLEDTAYKKITNKLNYLYDNNKNPKQEKVDKSLANIKNLLKPSDQAKSANIPSAVLDGVVADIAGKLSNDINPEELKGFDIASIFGFTSNIAKKAGNAIGTLPDKIIQGYKIEYDLSYATNGTGIFKVKVSKGKELVEYTWENLNSEESKKGIKSYIESLSELNKDVWEQAAAEVLSAGFSKDVSKKVQTGVKTGMNYAEKFVKVLSSEQDFKENIKDLLVGEDTLKLVTDMGYKKFKDAMSKKFGNDFKELCSLVEDINKTKKLSEKFAYGSDDVKLQTALQELQTKISEF